MLGCSFDPLTDWVRAGGGAETRALAAGSSRSVFPFFFSFFNHPCSAGYRSGCRPSPPADVSSDPVVTGKSHGAPGVCPILTEHGVERKRGRGGKKAGRSCLAGMIG